MRLAVVVVDDVVAHLLAGVEENVEQRSVRGDPLDRQVAPRVVGLRAVVLGDIAAFALEEVRQDGLPAPPGVPGGLPLVVVLGVPPGVDHVVDGRRPAEDFASGPQTTPGTYADINKLYHVSFVPLRIF